MTNRYEAIFEKTEYDIRTVFAGSLEEAREKAVSLLTESQIRDGWVLDIVTKEEGL